jgi:hypothetical protein
MVTGIVAVCDKTPQDAVTITDPTSGFGSLGGGALWDVELLLPPPHDEASKSRPSMELHIKDLAGRVNGRTQAQQKNAKASLK